MHFSSSNATDIDLTPQ